MKALNIASVAVIAIVAFAIWTWSTGPAQGRIPTSWHPTFARSEVVQPGHVVHTVVVPVQVRPGIVVDCVISEDSAGHRGSASMGLAMACDFATPLP